MKEKLTMPLATPVMVNQGWSLVGAKGASKLAVVGRTDGKASLPAAMPSDLGVGSTKAYGISRIALRALSAR